MLVMCLYEYAIVELIRNASNPARQIAFAQKVKEARLRARKAQDSLDSEVPLKTQSFPLCIVRPRTGRDTASRGSCET